MKPPADPVQARAACVDALRMATNLLDQALLQLAHASACAGHESPAAQRMIADQQRLAEDCKAWVRQVRECLLFTQPVLVTTDRKESSP